MDEINGKKVIVPKLYLSQKTKDRIGIDGKGAGIFADIVALEEAAIENDGLIKANTIVGSVSGLNNNTGAKIITAVPKSGWFNTKNEDMRAIRIGITMI